MPLDIAGLGKEMPFHTYDSSSWLYPHTQNETKLPPGNKWIISVVRVKIGGQQSTVKKKKGLCAAVPWKCMHTFAKCCKCQEVSILLVHCSGLVPLLFKYSASGILFEDSVTVQMLSQ